MAFFRVAKNKNFTVMSNHHLQDKELSLKAKGLLSIMLSLPDDWDFTVNGLVAIVKEEKTAVQTALKDLEQQGYLIREETRNSYGHFDYIYNIYEEPVGILPRTENPVTVNPTTDVPCTENQPQLNTKEQNTKQLNTKKENTDDVSSIEQLYIDLCPNLTPYQPSNYSKEILNLQKDLNNNSISWDEIKKAFKIANENAFLCGKVSDWKADFKWMIQTKNIKKILDGNYEEKTFDKKPSMQSQNYDFDAIRKRKKPDIYTHDYDVDDLEKQILRRSMEGK